MGVILSTRPPVAFTAIDFEAIVAEVRRKRAVRGVIESYLELFGVFTRGFPETGPKSPWVRLKRDRGS